MKTRIAQAAILLCLIALPLLAVSYFGYNSVGLSTAVVGGAEYHCAGRFPMPENGTASRIEMYTDNTVNDTTLAIYSDSANYPGTVLRQTAGGSVNGGSGTDDWRGQDLTSTYSLVSGANYWICETAATSGRDLFYDASGGHGYFIAGAYSSGNMATPFPGSATAWGIDFSIRVVYTPSGGGNSPKTLTTLGAGE